MFIDDALGPGLLLAVARDTTDCPAMRVVGLENAGGALRGCVSGGNEFIPAGTFWGFDMGDVCGTKISAKLMVIQLDVGITFLHPRGLSIIRPIRAFTD
jgi:hypothetical protein